MERGRDRTRRPSPFKVDQRISLLAEAINKATGTKTPAEEGSQHSLGRRLRRSPSPIQLYSEKEEKASSSINNQWKSNATDTEETRTRSRWQMLLQDSKKALKSAAPTLTSAKFDRPENKRLSPKKQVYKYELSRNHSTITEDEDGWILFSAHTAEKPKDSTFTGSESQQTTKSAFKDVRQTEIQTESPVFSVQSAEFSTPPIPPPVPKSMTKRSLARYHQVEPITTEPSETAVSFEPNSMATQTEKHLQIVEPSADQVAKPPKMKTRSIQIDFPESGLPNKKVLFRRSRSITPTRYRKMNGLSGNGRKDDIDIYHKKGGTTERSRMKRRESPSPERKSRTRKRGESRNMRRSKSQSNLREETKPPLKILKGRSQMDLREITPRVPVKTVIVDESKPKKQKTVIVDETKSNRGKNKDHTSGKKKGEKENEANGGTGNGKQKSRRNKVEELDKQKMENNLDKSKSNKKDKLHDKKITDLTDSKTDQTEHSKSKGKNQKSSKRMEKHTENEEVPTETKTANDDKDQEDDRVFENEKELEDMKDEIVAAGVDQMRAKDVEAGEKTEEEDKLMMETENADREVDIEYPPGVDDRYNEVEDLLATAGEDDSDIKDEIDPELLKKTEMQIFEKIKFYKDVLDGVKHKTWTLRKKMKMLKEAREYTAKFEGKLSKSGGPGQLARFKATWHKASREIANYAALLIPWEGRIKNIENYYGSVVASYFTFLRWIFWVNLIITALIGGFIVAPEVMFGPDMGTVDYKSVPANETKTASYLKTVWNFEGWVKYSPLFYGYYSSVKRFDSGWRMPLGFLIGNLSIFAYSFIAILRQIASNAKDEKASDKDDNFTFSWGTFANWDYMIGNAETAKNKFKSIVVSIRESITEQKEAKKKISKKKKAVRLLANFLVIVVLAGSTYAIYWTVMRSREFELKVKEEGPDAINAWQKNEVSVVMSLVTSFFPILFDIIGSIEDYHPRVALQRSLYRILVLYLLNLYTLYIALYWKIQGIQEEADERNATFYAGLNLTTVTFCSDLPSDIVPQLGGLSSNLTTNISTLTNLTGVIASMPCVKPFIADTVCWETMVGQELFKLTMFDLVTTVAVIYASEFFRAVFIKYLNACWCWDLERTLPGYATFSLAENLLHLVYNQGMIWMGTLFAPGLPALNLIKLLVMFYVRAWAVMVCNVPEERIFKAGSDNFYLLILLFMLYVVMVPIAFAMVSIRTSKICGPFREVEIMYLALTKWMDEVLPSIVNSILDYIASPGALIPIFILLFLILNYLKSSNEALHGAVLDLKKQLSYERTEGKKKVFSMADGAKQQPKKEEKRSSRSSGMLALRALSRMGGLKAKQPAGEQNFTSSDEENSNNNNNTRNVSFGGAVQALTLINRLKNRRQISSIIEEQEE